MKVFAITYEYTTNSGKNGHNGLSIDVAKGLEDVILKVRGNLEKTDDYDKGSFSLDKQVFISMPQLLNKINSLGEEEKIEDKSVAEIKKLPSFENLIKEL